MYKEEIARITVEGPKKASMNSGFVQNAKGPLFIEVVDKLDEAFKSQTDPYEVLDEYQYQLESNTQLLNEFIKSSIQNISHHSPEKISASEAYSQMLISYISTSKGQDSLIEGLEERLGKDDEATANYLQILAENAFGLDPIRTILKFPEIAQKPLKSALLNLKKTSSTQSKDFEEAKLLVKSALLDAAPEQARQYESILRELP
ncbi:MAG: hypothetical protein EOP04_24890 [Proteobacteria bacterium]|nr:MAG: hypothetical protein EOP04_24890 [Pseudomonadota bacterium]